MAVVDTVDDRSTVQKTSFFLLTFATGHRMGWASAVFSDNLLIAVKPARRVHSSVWRQRLAKLNLLGADWLENPSNKRDKKAGGEGRTAAGLKPGITVSTLNGEKNEVNSRQRKKKKKKA